MFLLKILYNSYVSGLEAWNRNFFAKVTRLLHGSDLKYFILSNLHCYLHIFPTSPEGDECRANKTVRLLNQTSFRNVFFYFSCLVLEQNAKTILSKYYSAHWNNRWGVAIWSLTGLCKLTRDANLFAVPPTPSQATHSVWGRKKMPFGVNIKIRFVVQ